MIVVKFGGTSVGDAAAIERAAGIVRDRLARRPVVVVSALGGATNSLLAVGEQSADVLDSLKETQDHEEPVDFLRVVVDGADVRYTVDGWPAAVWLRAGRGQVLVTTLAARGWVRPRTTRDGSSRDPIAQRCIDQIARSRDHR